MSSHTENGWWHQTPIVVHRKSDCIFIISCFELLRLPLFKPSPLLTAQLLSLFVIQSLLVFLLRQDKGALLKLSRTGTATNYGILVLKTKKSKITFVTPSQTWSKVIFTHLWIHLNINICAYSKSISRWEKNNKG